MLLIHNLLQAITEQDGRGLARNVLDFSEEQDACKVHIFRLYNIEPLSTNTSSLPTH